MKEWDCVEVSYYKEIAEKIETYQNNGWSLHTFSSAGYPKGVGHYLLFQREGNIQADESVGEAQTTLTREKRADNGRLARAFFDDGRVLDLGELTDPEARKKFFKGRGKKNGRNT